MLAELIEQAVRTPNKEKTGNVDAELIGVMARITTRIPTAQQVLSEPVRYSGDPRTLYFTMAPYGRRLSDCAEGRGRKVTVEGKTLNLNGGGVRKIAEQLYRRRAPALLRLDG